MEIPKPPSGLRAAGKRLWLSVVEDNVLNPGELSILVEACHTQDELRDLEKELRNSSLTVAGYNGQPRPNPLIKVMQDHRLLLRRLVDSLALPDVGEDVGHTSGQKHAQIAANRRWQAVS